MNDTSLPETPQDGVPAGCPMSRAGLGEHLPSRNNAAGQGRMTMDNGSPVYNNQDSMTAGPRGPGSAASCSALRPVGTSTCSRSHSMGT